MFTNFPSTRGKDQHQTTASDSFSRVTMQGFHACTVLLGSSLYPFRASLKQVYNQCIYTYVLVRVSHMSTWDQSSILCFARRNLNLETSRHRERLAYFYHRLAHSLFTINIMCIAWLRDPQTLYMDTDEFKMLLVTLTATCCLSGRIAGRPVRPD